MTSGGEFSEFDPAAEAEGFLPSHEVSEDGLSPAESAELQAEDELQMRIAAALAERHIELELAENQTPALKLEEVNGQLDRAQKRWNNLAARQIAGDIKPDDDAAYEALGQEMDKLQIQGELLSFVQHLAGCYRTKKEAPEILHEIIQGTITTIAASDMLTPSQKAAYFDVLEGEVGQNTFLEAMKQVSGAELAQQIAELAAQREAAVEKAQQLQDIQEILIHDFGLNNTGHEDWLDFTGQLQSAAERQQDETLESLAARPRTLARIYASAARLGIDQQKLAAIFARLGISPGND